MYVVVLSTSFLVALLGLAALSIVRIQRKEVGDVADLVNAQTNARFAIDMALYRIENDTSWRAKMTSGEWDVDQPVGEGSYRFKGFDAGDDDLNDTLYDSVTIIGTGKMGSARQKLQVQVHVAQPGLRCLEPAVHAEKKLLLDSVNVHSYRFLSANDVVEAINGAQVYADAEAASSVVASGGTFHGTTTTGGDWPRQMPNPITVFDYYTANGTAIDINDLPFWDANQLANPGIEDGDTFWVPYGTCTLAANSGQSHTGSSSLRVTQRATASSGPSQVITDLLQSGETYHAEVWIYVSGSASEDDFRLRVRKDSTGDGVQRVTMAPWKHCTNGQWTILEGDKAITWSGSLTEATWYVQSRDKTKNFRIDDAVFRIDNAPSGWRTIHRQLLSPTSNPFGAGTPNAQGIYVIDCQGEKLSIKDSRISGTLVLLQPNSDTTVHGSIHWGPVIVDPDPSVTNLPALLTDSEIKLEFDSTDLDEGQVNVNFNPAGTPYEGLSNSDKLEVYPSLMKGVIYSSKKIKLDNSPTILGVLVGHEDIEVRGSDLNVIYDPVYFENNPPPGFGAQPLFKVVPGSFQQVVD